MQYFILRTPGRPDEVARWKRRGAASYYDPSQRKWLADPLLAVELVAGGDWTPIDPASLPPELTADDPDPQRPRPARVPSRRVQHRSGLRRRFR